jgi:hypothetical protein
MRCQTNPEEIQATVDGASGRVQGLPKPSKGLVPRLPEQCAQPADLGVCGSADFRRPRPRLITAGDGSEIGVSGQLGGVGQFGLAPDGARLPPHRCFAREEAVIYSASRSSIRLKGCTALVSATEGRTRRPQKCAVYPVRWKNRTKRGWTFSRGQPSSFQRGSRAGISSARPGLYELLEHGTLAAVRTWRSTKTRLLPRRPARLQNGSFRRTSLPCARACGATITAVRPLLIASQLLQRSGRAPTAAASNAVKLELPGSMTNRTRLTSTCEPAWGPGPIGISNV